MVRNEKNHQYRGKEYSETPTSLILMLLILLALVTTPIAFVGLHIILLVMSYKVSLTIFAIGTSILGLLGIGASLIDLGTGALNGTIIGPIVVLVPIIFVIVVGLAALNGHHLLLYAILSSLPLGLLSLVGFSAGVLLCLFSSSDKDQSYFLKWFSIALLSGGGLAIVVLFYMACLGGPSVYAWPMIGLMLLPAAILGVYLIAKAVFSALPKESKDSFQREPTNSNQLLSFLCCRKNQRNYEGNEDHDEAMDLITNGDKRSFKNNN